MCWNIVFSMSKAAKCLEIAVLVSINIGQKKKGQRCCQLSPAANDTHQNWMLAAVLITLAQVSL